MTTSSPMRILCGMPQHDVLAEDDVAAAGAEQRRIQRLAQREAERAGHALRRQRDQLVLERARPSRAARRRAPRISRAPTCGDRRADPARAGCRSSLTGLRPAGIAVARSPKPRSAPVGAPEARRFFSRGLIVLCRIPIPARSRSCEHMIQARMAEEHAGSPAPLASGRSPAIVVSPSSSARRSSSGRRPTSTPIRRSSA